MNATNLEVRPLSNSAVFCVKQDADSIRVDSKVIRECKGEDVPKGSVQFIFTERSWISEPFTKFEDVVNNFPKIAAQLLDLET